MAILYAFDDHKNKVAFNGDTDIPVTVPMQLPDGSILFYDRGEQYGEYLLVNGEVERQSEGVDNGTYNSQNWRYLICDQADLDNTKQWWGPYGTSEGLKGTIVGYGLPNTEAMLAKYADNDDYWWKLIKEKRDDTGLDWFMPSKDELNMLYDNKSVISSLGGVELQSATYWSSSEYDNFNAWSQSFSSSTQYHGGKTNTAHCRLLRRI